ncbi:MAG: glycosyltransferase family 39 protein [Candidatus Levyibacteriota bacterium]|jgi:4-amino-4-deoxy-L-arabinose transferase-like glycosyltransferase
MEYLRKINKEIIFVLLIVVLAAVLRFLWLDKIPVGIGGDELTYVFNAKAIFLTGSDISGTWNPLSAFIFHYPAYTTPQAELPYFLLTPIVGFLQFSLFNARVTFAFLSVVTVLFVYLIAKEFFGSRVGVIAGLIAAINPWFIYIGRTDYEQVPATLFFLMGIYILLKAKGWKILWSVPILYLAFYSYIATKLIFLPLVAIAILYCYFTNKKQFLKQYAIVFGFSILIVAVYVFALKQISGSRLSEIFTPNAPILSAQVDAVRKITMQTPLANIFENKMTEYLKIIFTKTFDTTSFNYLFLTGDNFFALIRQGLFYVLDAVFLIFGLAAAYKRKTKLFFLLVSLSLIALLPHVLHTASLENFAPHITLLFPFAIILIAVGIDETLGFFKNKWAFYGVSALIILLYLLLFLNFVNIYFFQFSLQGGFDFPTRLLSKYVALASEDKQRITIYTPAVPDVFKKYIFYTNSYNQNTLAKVKAIYKDKEFVFGNVQFLGCNNTIDPTKLKGTIIYDFNCGALPKNYQRVVIPRLSDGGQSYDIFNDKLCQNFSLKGYPTDLQISDFSIETQTAQKFCETFITNP